MWPRRSPQVTPRSRGKRRVASHECAPPFQQAEFEIRWGSGIDSIGELLDLGVARGLVDKSGNHLAFADTPLGNGRERSRETLAPSPELQGALRQAILASASTRAGRRVDAEA